MSNISLDTHFYDSKLKEHVVAIMEKFTSDSSFEQTLLEITTMVANGSYNRKNEIMRTINIFRQSGNYDDTNNVSVDDILPRLWKVVKTWDDSAKNVFFEQLADVNNGACSQGRCTRLLQLFPL